MSSFGSTSSNSSQKISSHANFIEALKSTGQGIVQGTVDGVKNDLIAGGIKQATDTLFNTGAQSQQSQAEDFNFGEYLNSGEDLEVKYKKMRAHDKVKYEYENKSSETIIFNRRQEQVNKQIEEIQFELKKIAKEIVYIDQTLEVAVTQEVVDPGTYHLSYFEKLLLFLKQTRKRMQDARHWSAMHQNRSKGKSYFWNQADKKAGGTKFLLSQERQVVTQTG